ncbi:MAG TPA: DEAD/DEAH box helicase [Bryobacteraceae bacterium]|nr:DEAD/DEAH box helicase [Bryobacteraceae bacterium]
MNSFSDLITSPVLRNNLAKQAFQKPTPVQAQAIPPALTGNDVVATAQTGTGKTLAFALPILERLAGSSRGIQALILSPTRELAIQIEETFARFGAGSGVRTAVAVGGLSESKQLQAIRRGAQVLIATPGRLSDFLDRNLVALDGVRIAVLDEADRMLDMGFLPAVEAILAKTPREKQTLFFSATLEGAAGRLIGRYMNDPVRVTIGSTTRPADTIEMHLYEVEQDRKLGLLHSILDRESGSFLVFSRTKHGAERLAKKVSALGFKAAAIHGDRSQNQRNMALKGFQEGYYRVLVATDVASRGIHVDGIAHVVNYDLPQAAEDFIHRVGRTGRAGADGVATTFATSAERNEIRNIERTLKVKLTRKETPEGIEREVRNAPKGHGAQVIVMPKPQGFRARSQSFRPRRRFGSR